MDIAQYLMQVGGRMTDRAVAAALNTSRASVTRAKKRLAKSGVICFSVKSRRAGTTYVAGAAGVTKSVTIAVTPVTKTNNTYNNTSTPQERETRARAQGLDEALSTWEQYRGRVLIAEEEAEMTQWLAQLGLARLVGLIKLAWRRCTADRMSFGYFADYFINRLKKRDKEPVTKTVTKSATKSAQVRKEPPPPEPPEIDYSNEPWNKEEPKNEPSRNDNADAGGSREKVRREVEPHGSNGNDSGGQGTFDLCGLYRRFMQKGQPKVDSAAYSS